MDREQSSRFRGRTKGDENLFSRISSGGVGRGRKRDVGEDLVKGENKIVRQEDAFVAR